jgi:Holliday junction resolvasome RuvABC endonuclease subunit
MRIIGFDPSSSVTGWAVLDFEGGVPALVTYGKFSLKPKLSTTAKLRGIELEVGGVLHNYSPDQVAYEEAYVRFIKAAMPLYRVHGALILTVDRYARHKGLDIEPVSVNVNTARKQLGISDKETARVLINKTFSREFGKEDYDITDAIVIAWFAFTKIKTGERKEVRRKKG